MTVACGIDFGTTNSSIAVNVDGEVRVVALDDDLPYLRSQLFLHRDGDLSCGIRSTRRYLNESQYRTRCTACDRTPDRFIAPLGGSVTWLRDGCRQYLPGGGCSDARLLRGVKAELPDLHLTRTTSWAIEYRVESLVAIVMEELKRRAESSVGRPITRVVLGRPVVLGQTEEEDQLVEERLLRAAQLAGFEELAVCPEPVAAALEPVFGPARGRILSLDFGGGTFDAAVLLLHEDDGMLDPELEGIGGANVGGDLVDGLIFDRYFADYLGLTATEQQLGFRLPNRVRSRLKTRAGLVRLATDPAIYELLQRGTHSRGAAREMARLRDLILGGFGFGFYEAIEAAARSPADRQLLGDLGHGLALVAELHAPQADPQAGRHRGLLQPCLQLGVLVRAQPERCGGPGHAASMSHHQPRCQRRQGHDQLFRHPLKIFAI
jgi:Hsp70 protein